MVKVFPSVGGWIAAALICAASTAPQAQAATAQDSLKIWVRLRDKGPGLAAPPANAPTRSQRAYEDAPVHVPYVEALRARGFACDTRLKWQNLLSGRIAVDSLPRLNLPFVIGWSRLPRKAVNREPFPEQPQRPWRPQGLAKPAAGIDYGVSRALIESLHVDRVHAWMDKAGLRPGAGIKIAVIDDGFHLGNAAFAPLRSENRILDQWDFVADRPASVDDSLGDSHGASCTSLIGGNLPGTLVGVAPQASFLLYRSEEDAQERYVEEDYVAAAIERAVDSGAQVISISLGYRYEYTDGSPDLPFSVFDGRQRPSSLAALGAARRNVVVSIAVGNLPSFDHIPNGPTLGAPADADSVLAVGIVDAGRAHCGYSCTGPTADGRIKPEVSSMGVVVGCQVNVAAPYTAASVDAGAGTSYATPVIAGIAALVRQAHPEWTAMQVRDALMKTADHAAAPDNEVGYGLVDAWAALGNPPDPPAAPSGKILAVYHPGGSAPLILPWTKGYSPRAIRVIDADGRNIAVTLRGAGDVLLLDPVRDLRTGVYWVRALPVKD